MAEQLSLPLPTRPALGRDDFYVSPANAVALAAVEGWQDWPERRMAIVGPIGAGKTHLAHVFATLAGAGVIGADEIAEKNVDRLATRPLVIDGADRGVDEPAFFHLYNLMGARGHALLLTADAAPARWSVTLKDLASRLGTVPVAEISPPDDALLTAVLAKHFADRGIAPPARLIPYMVARMDRSLASAAHIVEKLDQRSLSTARPIGQKLAAEVMDKPLP